MLLLALLVLINASEATVQTFDTSFGKAQLDVPNGYELKDPNGKNVLQFVRSGSEKPIISIVVDGIEIFGSDLKEYANAHFGEGKIYEETTTNDGYKMNYYDINDNGDIHDYSGSLTTLRTRK